MTDEAAQVLRTFVGIVLTGYRDDQEGYLSLREVFEDDTESFVGAAFATISFLATLVGEEAKLPAEAVLEQFADAQDDPLSAKVFLMGKAWASEDDASFEDIGERAHADPRFVPVIFGATKGLATKLGELTHRSGEDVLRELAMTAAVGEAEQDQE